MPGFDALAPDQKAVLQLLLKQGKSYEDIAGLLRLERSGVRERALDALDALGAEAPGGLDPARQDELADHLLLQQTAAERAATTDFLESSAPGRAWARLVAGELQPLAGGALPAIPPESAPEAEPATKPGRVPEPALAPVADAASATGGSERAAAPGRARPSSRLGGVVVLVLVGVVIAVAVALLVRGGGDDDPAAQADTAPAATAAATCTTGGAATGATGASLPQQQVNLTPPQGSGSASSKALGYAILAQGGLAFQAEGLRRSNLYKVWLWSSASEAVPLGFAEYDRAKKRVAGAVQQLPAEAQGCAQIVITREASQQSPTPGPIVLSGPISRQ